jgi:hypothetical protein
MIAADLTTTVMSLEVPVYFLHGIHARATSFVLARASTVGRRGRAGVLCVRVDHGARLVMSAESDVRRRPADVRWRM